MDYRNPDKYKNYWKTGVSLLRRNEIYLRGYPLEEISGRTLDVSRGPAVPGGLAECDPECIHHLLHVQAKQLAGGRRGAEHAHCRGAVPAAVDRRGEGHAAGHIQPECYR